MATITRAHLKNACTLGQWDLLDKLLELDSTHINDRSYYTDTWGEWWGLLHECVLHGREKGVRVLLKHGADRTLGNWGDCIPMTPLEQAKQQGHDAIIALLLETQPPHYQRQTDPQLPELDASDQAVNQQGKLRDNTGLIFQGDDE